MTENCSGPLGKDVHSYGNFDEIRISHVFPDLTINFDNNTIHGFADLTATFQKDNVDKILLDIRALKIDEAFLVESENKITPLTFSIPKKHPKIGDCLQINFSKPGKTGEVIIVRVKYSTTEGSGGVQWFTPSQTSGGKRPFVYTQFEAILARSMIPLMDTPAAKITYEIKVRAPSDLKVACSGLLVGTPVVLGDGLSVTHFKQNVPIPSYLIAMVCGEVDSTEIGPRSRVWAELPVLSSAKSEYSVETENFLKAAEEITDLPYCWGGYDLMILPPSFPYGGMENPNLTFINSGLITGDRSLTDVVAHEIAHSWSGNLVTNSSWADFWLNEGFTMYLERLIIGSIHGEPTRHFHAILGYGELVRTVNSLKQSNDAEFSKLRPNLVNVDPDDAFSRIPYEKGCLFLLYLEKVVGGKDKMVNWLRSYFKHFERKSVDSFQMKDHFINHFKDADLSVIDWDTWFNGEYLPPYQPMDDLDTSIYKKCIELSEIWKNGGKEAKETDLSSAHWDAAMTMVFLDDLLNTLVPVNHDLLKKMDELYQLNKSKNPEIVYRWFVMCLSSSYLPSSVLDSLSTFLSKNGRGIYLRPLYNQLIKQSKRSDVTSKIIELHSVKSIYNKNRPLYHSVIRNSFDETLL